MDKKRVFALLGAVAILAALAIVLFLFLRDTDAPVQEIDDTSSQQFLDTSSQNTTPVQDTDDASTSAPALSVAPSVVARTFVERVGSYSSESSYANVDDVLGLVTDDLAQKLSADAIAARKKTTQEDGGYYGISTVYLGATIEESTDTRTTLLVQTQREESFGSPKNAQTRYQTVRVTLVLVDDVWKVSSYTWEE